MNIEYKKLNPRSNYKIHPKMKTFFEDTLRVTNIETGQFDRGPNFFFTSSNKPGLTFSDHKF